MKKTLFIVFLSMQFWVQTQTLTTFTQSNCNNCKYTKYMLQKNSIAFRNLPLEEKENAAEMLEKLKKAGYTGQIHLPVIFENDTILLYPSVPHNDSTLYFVVEKIVTQKVK